MSNQATTTITTPTPAPLHQTRQRLTALSTSRAPAPLPALALDLPAGYEWAAPLIAKPTAECYTASIARDSPKSADKPPILLTLTMHYLGDDGWLAEITLTNHNSHAATRRNAQQALDAVIETYRHASSSARGSGGFVAAARAKAERNRRRVMADEAWPD
jgi:hypothetical protein